MKKRLFVLPLALLILILAVAFPASADTPSSIRVYLRRLQVEDTLRVREHLLDRRGHVQVLGEVLGLALVGELELVLQVVEPVVDRGGREHEDLGLHALLDDLAHKALVARLLLFGVVGVAEIVRLVDHHEVVVAPVDPIQT